MSIQEAGVELIAKGADSYISSVDRARGATDSFVGSTKDAEARTGGGSGSFSMIGMAAANFIGTMAVQAFTAATQAAADFVGDTITVAADYESTMNRFAAVTGTAVADAGMDLEQFNQLFLDMGAKTQFSAQQAADAAVNLAKGGMDPATIAAGGLEGALALAAAGELDLAQAAEITAKTLGVWGDTGVDAAKAADLMAQAANASTVDVDDLAIGLANVGGTAKTAGVSFQDTVQAMALLAPGFSSASDAGTSFKTFLSRLIPTTDKQTDAMVDLGLATEDGKSVFFDAQGEFIGMQAAAEKLQNATAGLTEEQKLLALNTIFGQDAIRAAAILATNGAEGFDAMGESMAAAGSAADQAAMRNQGLNFALESLKGSWETIQIVLGTALLPIMTDFLNTAVIPLANAVLAFAQENMPALTGALSGAQGSIQPLIDNFLWFVDAIGAVAGGVDNANEYLGELPAGLQPIAAAAGELLAAFKDSLPMIQTYITDMKDTAVKAAEDLGPLFGERITSIINTLTEFWKAHGEEVMMIVNFLFRTVVAVAGGAMILIMGAIDVGLKFISGIWDAASKLLQGDWEGAWTSMSKFGEDIWNTIGKTLADTIDFFIKTFSGGTLELDENWRTTLEGLGTTLLNMRDGFLKGVGDFIGGAVEAAGKAAEGFVTVGENIINGMKQGIQNIAASLALEVANAALGALNSAKAALGIKSPSTVFENQVGEMMGAGAIEGLWNMQSALERATAELFGGVGAVASSAARASTQSGSSYSYSNSRNFNLTLNTQQSTGSVLRDFGVMELMAG